MKKKSLGQNFLINTTIIQKLVDSLDIKDEDYLVEIGGGAGAVTKELLMHNNKFKQLDVIEIDREYSKELTKISSKVENCRIICDDFLITNYPPVEYKVIGAIPYYISSPIIHKILESKLRPSKVILCVQKEFGEKMIQNAPKASYWSHITIGYKTSKIMDIKAENFDPAPEVDSMAVVMELDEKTNLDLINIGFFRWSKFLHHVYRNPRKMLNKVFEKNFLIDAGISSSLRPQNLTTENVLGLYQVLNS